MKRTSQTLCALWFLANTAIAAEPPAIPSPPPQSPATAEMNAAEEKLAVLLTGSVLEGEFSMGLETNTGPRKERYVIESARKVKGDMWVIQSRMKVGQNELPIPVPVQMQWAGDTPMLQLTNLNIPLVGEGFTARILFYGDRYAGIWEHGKIGGHLWGRVVKPLPGSPAAAPAAPGVPVEKDGPLP